MSSQPIPHPPSIIISPATSYSVYGFSLLSPFVPSTHEHLLQANELIACIADSRSPLHSYYINGSHSFLPTPIISSLTPPSVEHFRYSVPRLINKVPHCLSSSDNCRS